MAERRARQYELQKIEMTLVGGETYDIREIVADFVYYESIESPFIRCDFTIADAIDFNKTLMGGETIHVKLKTNSSKGDEMDVKLRVFKIGSIIKSERGQMYILHTASPEIYTNELKKVFKSFGPMDGAKNKDNLAKYLVEEYWDAKDKCKSKYFEGHSTINFISPNWKVTDAISYISDKVVRQKGSKGSTKQSGFLFFENKKGYCFQSIDSLCEGSIDGAENFTYKLAQQGNETKDDGMYLIESIQYPDKADHLRNLRMGTYKSLSIGISLPVITDSTPTDSGNSNKRGTVRPPLEINYQQVFSMASTIEKKRPYEMPEGIDLESAAPTRMHIRALPEMKNQEGAADPKAGTNGNEDTKQVALYAAARYSLLKSVQVTIVIPGNVALTVGQILKLSIPASEQTGGENGQVKEDLKYSGKYLIQGLKHTYKRDGVTTELMLTRDSIKKQSY
jgi:hypothetical protein